MLLVFLLLIPGSTALFEGCDHNLWLNLDQIYEVELTGREKVPCRWWVKTPKDTVILFTCPKLTEKTCTGVFTLKRMLTPEHYCNNRRFFGYSDVNQLIVEFKTNITHGEYSLFRCYLSVEPRPTVCNRCGNRNTTADWRILGGERTRTNEFPMMAGLRLLNTVQFFCGATIIAESYALTAAICVKKRMDKDIALVVGEHDLSTEHETWSTEMHQIDKIIIHPDFKLVKKGFVINDIAIVRVAVRIRFNPKVEPACLPFKSKKHPLADEEIVGLGWGRNGQNGVASPVLEKITGFIWSDIECVRIFSKYPIERSHLCVTYQQHGTCRGDSGGPVLWRDTALKYQLVGIHSTVRMCTRRKKPTISTRVTSYLEWIEENTPGAVYCK